MWSLATALVVAALSAAVYRRCFHPLSRYPGPLLASCSNLWRFCAYLGGRSHLVEQKLHERYGHVVRIGPNSLSFAGLDDFEAIYGYHKAFEKGEFYAFGRDADTQAGSIFTAPTDAVHREHRRRVVGPALVAGKIPAYGPVVAKHVGVLLARLQQAATAAAAVDVEHHVHRFTLDAMVDVVFGEPISPEPYTDTRASDGMVAALNTISKFAWGSSYLPWLGRLMATKPMVKMQRAPKFDRDGHPIGVSALTASTRALIFDHPERAVASHRSSILRNFLQVPESDARRMSPSEMWRECFNLVIAGPGSTAAALTATIHRLGTAEGVAWQARIRADPPDPAVIAAVIKETMRLHAPFPTGFPRTVAAGAETAIPNLPAPLPVGTVVSANPYVLGRATALWGPDADAWKPDRWLGDDGERKRLDDRFVVFGKGARGCVGREIAMMMLTQAVRAVVARWDVRAEGELRGSSFLEMQYSACMVALAERSAVR
jgi:cytochrome P450